MSEKQVNNGLKSALEFGPVALFFIAYIWLKDEVFQFGGADDPQHSGALETDWHAVKNADFYCRAGDGFWRFKRLAK